MASATFTLDSAARSRRRAFFLPREHGAWGMLLVPLAVGAAVGHPHLDKLVWILLFAVAALGLFCLRTPVESALGLSPVRPQNHGERRLVYFFIFYYASAALLALIALICLGHAYALFLLGFISGLAFLLQAVLKRLGRSTRLNSQLVGSIALSSTAAGADYPLLWKVGSPRSSRSGLPTGSLPPTRFIFVTQLRIHTARIRNFWGKSSSSERAS